MDGIELVPSQYWVYRFDQRVGLVELSCGLWTCRPFLYPLKCAVGATPKEAVKAVFGSDQKEA